MNNKMKEKEGKETRQPTDIDKRKENSKTFNDKKRRMRDFEDKWKTLKDKKAGKLGENHS